MPQPLSESTPIEEILTHLCLLEKKIPVNAAVLLFAREPQRFLLSSEIKCTEFHGTEIEKPIPSYQVYKGTVFDLVDQSVNFVLSRINIGVGTRSKSNTAPVTYEIPREVIVEAIVNAVAHRDYTNNGSVQVMIFSDRLEIWNPGTLPSTLSLEKLRGPHGSVPANPLLAEPMYLARYIERMGTGTRDMIRRCREFGLKEPLFNVSDGFTITIFRPAKSTGEVLALVTIVSKAMTRKEMMVALNLKGDDNFRKLYQLPALDAGLIEMTITEKPNSSKKKRGYTMGNLDETDKKALTKAVELLQSYGAQEIYLFGSMARGDMDQYSDWDIAVKGLHASEYYTALAKLMQILSRSVDLVDLDETTPFSAYGRSKKEFTRVA